MKSICNYLVWATILLLATSNVNAQETKQFTLEELIPGGKDFYNFTLASRCTINGKATN